MKETLNFEVARCSRQDLDEVLHFAKKMNDARVLLLPFERENLLNKYRQSSDDSENLNLFILKAKNGEVIGCSGYVPFKGIFNERKIDGIVCTDAVIDPHYRSRFPGLFTLLFRNYEDLFFKDKCFPLLFPLNEVTEAYKQSLGWREFTPIQEFFKPLISKTPPDLKSSSIELKRVECFDKEINSFFRRISHQHHFLMHADAGLLNWKYFHNPYRQSFAALALKKGKILGYVVAERKGSDIHIIDIVVDLEYPQAIVLLIYDCLTHFNKYRISKAVCCLSHKEYIEIFQKAGFLYQRQYLCLFFRVALLFHIISQDELSSCDKDLYHLNGFARHLY